MAHGYNTQQKLVLQLHELNVELTFFIGDKLDEWGSARQRKDHERIKES
jgi:hypothetical protein